MKPFDANYNGYFCQLSQNLSEVILDDEFFLTDLKIRFKNIYLTGCGSSFNIDLTSKFDNKNLLISDIKYDQFLTNADKLEILKMSDVINDVFVKKLPVYFNETHPEELEQFRTYSFNLLKGEYLEHLNRAKEKVARIQKNIDIINKILEIG